MAKKAKKQSATMRLCEAIKDLDWCVGIPKTRGNVPGLIIGNEAYVTSIEDALTKAGWKYKAKRKTKKG